MPGRSLTGEQRVVASELLLKFDDVTPQGALTSNLVDALQFFLKASQLNDTTFDATSEDAVTARRISEYVLALVDERRRKDEKVTVGDVEGLTSFLFPWRMKADWYHDLIFLKEGNAYYDLMQRIQGLSPRTNGFNTILQQHEHSFRPTIKRVMRHYHQTVREGDHHHIWAPGQLNRTYQTIRTVQEVHSEHHHLMTVKKTGGYTLENADPNGLSRGGVVLKRDGVIVSTVQVVPDPTNQQNMLLSADSAGTLHFANAGSHTAAHGSFGGSGSASDNFIGSLDFLSSTGHIRAIMTPNQVVVNTPQSLDSRYYTKAEIDALLVTINGYITALNASIGANAVYSQGLNTRLVAVEGAMPTFKFAGGTAQPLLQLQVKSGDFPGTAFYTGGTLKIATSTPPDANPY